MKSLRQPMALDYPRRRPGWRISDNTLYLVHALLEDAGYPVTMFLASLVPVQMPCHDDAVWI